MFFPGGTAGGGFETVVYNGAKAAQAAFGPNVTYQWSDWDPNKMITQFQQAMATKPDGIAVMGHPGDAAFDPLIDQAASQGIVVTVMNTELPQAEAKYVTGPATRARSFTTPARRWPRRPIKRGSLQAGDGSSSGASASQPGRGERTKGITDALTRLA